MFKKISTILVSRVAARNVRALGSEENVMKVARMLRTLLLAVILAALGTTAGAVDMEGTWEGKERCDCFNEVDGKFTERRRDEVMKITQEGMDLNIQAYGELFNGNVIGDPRSSSKGQASLIACSTDPADNASFGQTGRAKVSVKANGRGRMTIESLWSADENEVCTCRSKMHRTHEWDPEVGGCSVMTAIDKWHRDMLARPMAGVGCDEAEFPHREWRGVDCAEAPIASKRAHGKRGARTAGSGNDFVVSASSGHTLGQVTGSFTGPLDTVTSLADSGPPGDLSKVANKFSLQMNSDLSGTGSDAPSVCKQSTNKKCQGWQQGVYAAKGTDHGYLTIQYWLFEYTDDPTWFCPDGWLDGMDPHRPRSCVKNANCPESKSLCETKKVDPVGLAEFKTMQLTMQSGHDSHDSVIVRIDRAGASKLHRTTAKSPLKCAPEPCVQAKEGVENLAQWWKQAEFNVFGFGGGSTAEFNDDANFDVQMKVDQRSGGTVSCLSGGTTGEMNDLRFIGGACTPSSSNARLPTFTFNQRGKDSHLGQPGQWCNDASQCAAPSVCALGEYAATHLTCLACNSEHYPDIYGDRYSTCMVEGAKCHSDAMCASNYCDNGLLGATTGRCRDKRADGVRCEHNAQCHSAQCAKAKFDAEHKTCLNCDYGHYVYTMSDYSTCMQTGSSCRTDWMCANDNCYNDTCSDKLGDGVRCEVNSQCHSDQCGKAEYGARHRTCLPCDYEHYPDIYGDRYSTCMPDGYTCHSNHMCHSEYCDNGLLGLGEGKCK